MANSRRVDKLAALLKREVSELLVNGVRDERIHQAMITITSVEVSGDLQHAKIFVSLFECKCGFIKKSFGCFMYPICWL